MKPLPCLFKWDQSRQVMMLDPRYVQVARRQFHDGEEYPLAVVEVRSMKSHNHYFAALHEAFMSLPEEFPELRNKDGKRIRPPPGGFIDEEHFRQWCLVEMGWAISREFVLARNRTQQKRLAAWIRNEQGDHVVIKIGQVQKETHDEETGELYKYWPVTTYRAMSQSMRAMGRDEFEASKKDVLELARAIIDVSASELKRAAGRSA